VCRSRFFNTLGSLLKDGEGEVLRTSVEALFGLLKNGGLCLFRITEYTYSSPGVYSTVFFVDSIEQVDSAMSLSILRSRLIDSDWRVRHDIVRILAIASSHGQFFLPHDIACSQTPRGPPLEGLYTPDTLGFAIQAQ